jgi:hypothetical protein
MKALLNTKAAAVLLHEHSKQRFVSISGNANITAITTATVVVVIICIQR